MESPTGRLVVNNLQTTTARQICTGEVALMTLWLRIAGMKHENVRVLLDCGSHRSYISESLAAELELPIVSKKNVAITLFGSSRTETKLHNKYRVKLCSASLGAYSSLEFEFLDQNVICGNILRVSKGSILKELKRNNIWLSDMGADCPKIDILIGSDNYDRTAPTLCTSLAVHNFNISDLWSLEAIGILDANQNLSNAAEKEIAHDQFLSSLTRKENGCCSAGLPWLESSVELPSNYQVAEKRWFGITRRLRSLRKYEEYDEVFKEWLEEGVIAMVPDRELNSKGHYLPHHPVFKPESVTTKIRPVFDASCKVGNDCLVTEPISIEEIPSIWLRFREKCIAVTSDIRHAFLQIELRKEDGNLLRYL
ncbi:uncharacterized protein TNIN_114531 [Trichonephila inaurata madagascariensis]|uniref:Peptidase aspartic putative domain-containing protein n=1 Tax=Trichonephila inaurata madagascariensis TaxID=2747483 RepID=A0A8X6Y1T4_9ARAC|nr:uncharacterized protein TNIN_114531 [Trichonephila inaurata madagascariensis]